MLFLHRNDVQHRLEASATADLRQLERHGLGVLLGRSGVEDYNFFGRPNPTLGGQLLDGADAGGRLRADAEALKARAELAHIDNLRVISRTSSMRYRGSAAPLPEIARQLGVSHLIEGSISRDKSRVRVTAQLIEAGADRHVWARTYDGTTADILDLQATIASEIAADVEAALSPH